MKLLNINVKAVQASGEFSAMAVETLDFSYLLSTSTPFGMRSSTIVSEVIDETQVSKNKKLINLLSKTLYELKTEKALKKKTTLVNLIATNVQNVDLMAMTDGERDLFEKHRQLSQLKLTWPEIMHVLLKIKYADYITEFKTFVLSEPTLSEAVDKQNLLFQKYVSLKEKHPNDAIMIRNELVTLNAVRRATHAATLLNKLSALNGVTNPNRSLIRRFVKVASRKLSQGYNSWTMLRVREAVNRKLKGLKTLSASKNKIIKFKGEMGEWKRVEKFLKKVHNNEMSLSEFIEVYSNYRKNHDNQILNFVNNYLFKQFHEYRYSDEIQIKIKIFPELTAEERNEILKTISSEEKFNLIIDHFDLCADWADKQTVYELAERFDAKNLIHRSIIKDKQRIPVITDSINELSEELTYNNDPGSVRLESLVDKISEIYLEKNLIFIYRYLRESNVFHKKMGFPYYYRKEFFIIAQRRKNYFKLIYELSADCENLENLKQHMILIKDKKLLNALVKRELKSDWTPEQKQKISEYYQNLRKYHFES